MKVGVTGTRRPTRRQVDALRLLLAASAATEMHHGDCVGTDKWAHRIAGGLGMRRVSHPPLQDKARAFVVAEETRPPATYMDRNEAIVDETDVLIAVVPGPESDYPRSGTWATVRYARRVHGLILLVWPDGTETADE